MINSRRKEDNRQELLRSRLQVVLTDLCKQNGQNRIKNKCMVGLQTPRFNPKLYVRKPLPPKLISKNFRPQLNLITLNNTIA